MQLSAILAEPTGPIRREDVVAEREGVADQVTEAFEDRHKWRGRAPRSGAQLQRPGTGVPPALEPGDLTDGGHPALAPGRLGDVQQLALDELDGIRRPQCLNRWRCVVQRAT